MYHYWATKIMKNLRNCGKKPPKSIPTNATVLCEETKWKVKAFQCKLIKKKGGTAQTFICLLPKLRTIMNEYLLHFGSQRIHTSCIWSSYDVKSLRYAHPVKSYTDINIILMWQYTVILSPRSFFFSHVIIITIISWFIFFPLPPRRVVAVVKKSI